MKLLYRLKSVFGKRHLQTMQQHYPSSLPAAFPEPHVKRMVHLTDISEACLDLLLAGKCQEAQNLLVRYYHGEGVSKSMPLPIPTIPLANAFIEAHLQKGTPSSVGLAKEILFSMGCKADAASYGLFIRYYMEWQNWAGMQWILGEMAKRNFVKLRHLQSTGIFTSKTMEQLYRLCGTGCFDRRSGEFKLEYIDNFVFPASNEITTPDANIPETKKVLYFRKKHALAEVKEIPSSSGGIGFIKRSLSVLTSWDDSEPIDLVEVQKQIEKDCLKEAVASLKQDWKKLQESSSGPANLLGSKWIVSRWALELAKAISPNEQQPSILTEATMNSLESNSTGTKLVNTSTVCKSILSPIEPEKVALIVLQQLLKMGRYSFEMGAIGDSKRSVWPGCNYTTLCGDIGRSLEYEIFANQISKNTFVSRFYRKLNNLEISPEEEKEIIDKLESKIDPAAEQKRQEKEKFSSEGRISLKELAVKNRIEQRLINGRQRSRVVKEVQSVLGGDQRALSQGWMAAWTQEKRHQIGAFCLDLALRTLTDPFPSETIFSRPFVHQIIRNPFTAEIKNLGIVRIDRRLYDRFTEPSGELLEHLGVEPWCLPMVVQPKDWMAIDKGGYYVHQLVCVRTREDPSHLALLAQADSKGALTKLYEGLNYLGSTAWTINDEVLRVALDLWNSDVDVANLNSNSVFTNDGLDQSFTEYKREDEFDSHEEYVLYVQKMVSQRKLASESHSTKCDTNYKLELARSYSGTQFYFPHNVDFRGRAYPIPPYLNHLGSDLSRGLLLFAEGKPLGGQEGLKWLKIQLANMLGKDKLPFAERVAYVDQQMDIIREVAKDPLGAYKDFWIKADEPWQSLAACLEVVKASDDPENFLSRLPVQQDGSCNGLQHYAALGGDVWGASQVNLLPSERPQDIYATVAKIVKEELERMSEPLALKLKEHVPVTRKIVKTPVMTNVYGVTSYGAKKQIAGNIQEIHGDVLGRDLMKASALLADLVFKALDGLFVQARRIQDWLTLAATEIGRAVPPDGTNMNGSLVTWTNPLGFPVIQPYHKRHNVHLKTTVQTITLTCPDSTRIDAHKQAAGFPPNFVHSLDASHMFLTALRCQEAEITFASVHDCYWTHAGSVNTMARELREAFVTLHEKPILENLRKELEERYCGYLVTGLDGKKRVFGLPPVPTRGPLDINQVKQSLYFFS